MNCIKCNAFVPEGSKFCPECGNIVAAPTANKCPSCGNDIAAGARFCAVCGTAVAAAATEPVAPVAAPVSAIPTPAAEPVAPVAAPVSAIPTPAAEPVAPVAAPVSAIPTPAAEPVAPVAAPASAIPTPAAEPVAPVTAPVSAIPTPAAQPVASATPANTQGFNAPAAFTQSQPAQFGGNSGLPAMNYNDMSSASAVAVKPIKKKSPVLWIILAIVAVIAICGCVIGFCFRGVAENVVLGDEKYAAKIEANGITTAMNSVIPEGTDSTQLSQLSSDAISEVLTLYRSIDEMESGEAASFDLEGLMKFYNKTFTDVYGTNGANVTYDLDVEITEAGKSSLELTDDVAPIVTEIIDILNSIKLSAEVAADPDKLLVQYGVDDGEGFKADAKITMYADGTMALTLPSATQKAIVVKLDTGAQPSEKTEELEVSVDYEQLDALMSELIEIYLTAYAESEVEIEKAELEAADVKAEGRLIVVEMDDEKLGKMLAQMIDHIADNEYLAETMIDIANYCGANLTKENYKTELEELANSVEDSVNVSLTVKTLVDNNSNVLGKSYSLKSEDQKIELAYVQGENKFGVVIKNGKDELMTAVATQENETDGTIHIEVDAGDTELGTAIGMNIEYSGVKMVEFGASEVIVGDFHVYLAGTEKSEEDGSALKIGMNYSVDGDAYKGSAYAEFVGYGKLAFNTVVTPKNIEIGSVPADALDITNVDTWTEEQNKESLQYLKEALVEIKDAWSDENSTISSYVVPALEQAIASLEEELVEKVGTAEINALSEKMNAALEAFETKYYDAYSYCDYEDMKPADELYNKMYEAYSELYWIDELTLEQYNEYCDKFDSLIKESEAMMTELDKLMEEAKNDTSSQTGTISGEPIEAAVLYGTWDLSYIDMYGEVMTAADLDLGEYSVTFNEDGTVNCIYFEMPTSGTWSINDSTVTVSEYDAEYDYSVDTVFTYSDGLLKADDGEGYVIAFAKR